MTTTQATTDTWVPPQNQEAEIAVLGAMILSGDALDKVSVILRREDFMTPQHGIVFDALANLREDGQPIDPVILQNELARTGHFEDVGGNPFIAQIMERVPEVVNAEYYARVIRNHARHRDVIKLLNNAYGTAYHATEYNDVVGMLAQHHQRVKALVENLDAVGGPLKLERVNAADIQARPVRWLWRHRFARGKLNIIAGDPGLGKSLLTADVAARVSTGRAWPDDNIEALSQPGRVLWLQAEDDNEDTIVPRLIAHDADRGMIDFLGPIKDRESGNVLPFTLEHLGVLEHEMRQTDDLRLVIIDPLSAYCGDGRDTHRDASVRGLLAPLRDLAEKYQVAVVGVTHLNKNEATKKAIARVTGSLAFVAAARVAWLLAKDPENEKDRLLLPLKTNVAPNVGGLRFHIERAMVEGADPCDGVPQVCWHPGIIETSADDALASESRDPDEKSALDAAIEFLGGTLDAGPVPQKDVQKLASQNGISPATLRRARAKLGIKSRKDGFGAAAPWLWHPHR